ncbi:MAG: hypothetical protein ABI693_26110 [Bryobacteraceae bacterium]
MLPLALLLLTGVLDGPCVSPEGVQTLAETLVAQRRMDVNAAAIP